MFKNDMKLFLECHGEKIPGDFIVLPKNIRVISFSTEYELGYNLDTALFKFNTYKYSNNNFIDSFIETLYYFGSELINMSYLELYEECIDREITLGPYDSRNKLTKKIIADAIINTINLAGKSANGNQKIVLHNPGDIINNYQLSSNIQYDGIYKKYEISEDEIIIKDESSYDKSSYEIDSENYYGEWKDMRVHYIVNEKKYIDNKTFYSMISRDGLCLILRDDSDKIFTESLGKETFTNKINKLLETTGLASRITFKYIINKLANSKENFILFVNHCKQHPEGVPHQPQRQRKRLQTLGLLQGIGLQLALKSPKKKNLKKNLKKHSKSKKVVKSIKRK
jgi:hypothetical protein